MNPLTCPRREDIHIVSITAIAKEKLAAMGIAIDDLTPEQEKYLASWNMGT